MIHKFLIVLLAAILYDGVTCSPTNVQSPGANIPEEKPPTVSPVANDHINEQIKNTSIPKVLSVKTFVSKNISVSEALTPTATPKSAGKDTTSLNIPPVVDAKNKDEMAETKHEEYINKNADQVAENKSMTKVIHNDDSSHPMSANNINVPNNSSSSSPIPPVVKTITKASPVPTQASPLATQTSPVATQTSPVATQTSPVATQATVKTTSKPDSTTFVPTFSSTDKVIVEHSKPTPSEEKHFDGPSFIGGIVLTIGLTAIGFIAFKYYKSGKIDRNYRTL